MYNDFNDNTIGAGAFCCSQRIGAVASHRGGIQDITAMLGVETIVLCLLARII